MNASRQALAGVRVLDLGIYWGGPYAGKLLADMGAEVIKVEGPRRPDLLRIEARGLYPDREPGEHPWNRSGMINERNRNKLGITLDLAKPAGIALFKELVKISDVVIENFSARVMPSLGLGFETLSTVNPQVVMVSVTSQGLSGPEKDYISFGNTLEQTGGLAAITGYPDRASEYSSGAYPDPIGGLFAVAGAIAGLRQRRLTGLGVHVEVSQREAVTHFLGEVILDYSMNKRIHGPIGNRHPFLAPHGCYRCQGDDRWVTIAAGSEEEWQALCRTIGREDLIHDPRFAEVHVRYEHQDELDSAIEAWTQTMDNYEAMHLLQRSGVTAHAVARVSEVMKDPHLLARGFFETSPHPEAGTHQYYSRPWQFSRTPGATYLPAPCFGEHNHKVLGELLGLNEEEVRELEEHGIIGTTPLMTG